MSNDADREMLHSEGEDLDWRMPVGQLLQVKDHGHMWSLTFTCSRCGDMLQWSTEASRLDSQAVNLQRDRCGGQARRQHRKARERQEAEPARLAKLVQRGLNSMML